MYGYIYKITNLKDGNVYIGKHKYSKNELDENYIAGGIYINNAIKKYGLDNFKRELIDTADTLSELNDLEKYYIKEYNSIYPNGYNLTTGGDGLSEPLPYVIELNRKAHLGKKATEETKKKQSESLKKVKHTVEWSKKISTALKGKSPSYNTRMASIERHKGFQWYNDGIIEYQLKDSDNKEGLIKGRIYNTFGDQTGHRLTDEQKEKISKSKSSQKWYNNGIKEIMSIDCPEGYVRGRLPLSEERKEQCRINGRKSKGNTKNN